jgi:glycine cleavage system pyridoxal-binding protein P
VRELALASHATAEYLKAGLRRLGGKAGLAFPDSPTYNEFLLCHDDPEALLSRLAEEGILAGVATTRFGGALPKGVLVAATEKNTREECDRLLAGLGRSS